MVRCKPVITNNQSGPLEVWQSEENITSRLDQFVLFQLSKGGSQNKASIHVLPVIMEMFAALETLHLCHLLWPTRNWSV